MEHTNFPAPNLRRLEPEELAEITYQAMQGYRAVLLQNHGLIAGAETIEQAMYIAEEMESMAQLHFLAKGMGDPVILTAGEDMNGKAIG